MFDRKTLKNIFIGVVACILLYWLLHETERVRTVYTFVKGVLSPFIIGAGIAFILNVPMRAIENHLGDIKNPVLRRSVALVLTFLALLLVLAIVFWLLIPQVIATAETFAAKLPGFFSEVQAAVMKFLGDNPELLEWINANTDFQHINVSALIQKVVDMVGTSVSTIVSGAFSAIGSLTTAIFNAVISVVFALYCLARKEILSRQCRRLVYAFLPEKAGDQIVRILRLTNATFSNFLSGQFVEVCILGCMFAISMAIFRMPYIPLVSVLVAVTAFIPVVGAFVGCIVGALFILVDNPLQAVWFVIMFLVLQQIEGNLIYPRVVGAHIGLPGMWVLFAVAIGGELMGISGMFLMIPMASVLYTLLGEITRDRLAVKNVPYDKLLDHPPELSLKSRERRKKRKAKSEATDQES